MSRFQETPGGRWPAAACLQLWLVQLHELFSSLASVSQWASDHIFILTQSLWLGSFVFFLLLLLETDAPPPSPVSLSAWCSGPTGMSRSPASWGPLWLGRTWGSSWAPTSWRPMGWRSTTKRRSSTSQTGALEKSRDVTMTVLADTWVGSPHTCASVSGWLTALHLCLISEWRKLFNYRTSEKRDTCSGTEPRHWSALSSSKGNSFYVACHLTSILIELLQYGPSAHRILSGIPPDVLSDEFTFRDDGWRRQSRESFPALMV